MLLLNDARQFIQIMHHPFEAVAICQMTQVLYNLCRLAMPALVMDVHDVSVPIQLQCESLIPGRRLCHAVTDLHHSFDLSVTRR